MNNIQDFIQTAVQQLGTGEKETRAATGGLLQFVKKEAAEGDFNQLLEKIPGAENLLSAAPQAAGATAGGGGLLGDLAGKAVSSIGGGSGSAAGLMGILKNAGFDLGKAGPFVSLFLSFAREKAGSDLMSRITSKIPQLGS